MNNEYIEQHDGGYWIAGNRVSLDSIVYAFLAGEPAENIARLFPTLKLVEVYAAICYYLDHRPEIDAYLAKARTDFEAARQASRDRDPVFYQRLANVRGA